MSIIINAFVMAAIYVTFAIVFLYVSNRFAQSIGASMPRALWFYIVSIVVSLGLLVGFIVYDVPSGLIACGIIFASNYLVANYLPQVYKRFTDAGANIGMALINNQNKNENQMDVNVL